MLQVDASRIRTASNPATALSALHQGARRGASMVIVGTLELDEMQVTFVDAGSLVGLNAATVLKTVAAELRNARRRMRFRSAR